VSIDGIYFVLGANNCASLALPVPVNASLVGVQLFQQGYALDPGWNALGMTVSNSVRITVGHL
jgi:hypothetical protein